MNKLLVALPILFAGVRWLPSENRAPEMEPVPDVSVRGTGVFELTLTAHDSDGDTLWYTAENLPPGATLDARTGHLRWYTGSLWWGFQQQVVLRVSDGSATDVETTTFQVLRTDADNEAPRIDVPTLVSVVGECNLVVPLRVVDPDGDTLELQWSTYYGDHARSLQRGLPPGARYDEESGTLRWTPSLAQAGQTYHVAVRAHDRAVRDARSSTRTITVRVEQPRPFRPASNARVDDVVGRWKVIERMDDVPPAPKFFELHADGTGTVDVVLYRDDHDLATLKSLDFFYELTADPSDPQVGTLTMRDHRGLTKGRAYRLGDRLVLDADTGYAVALARCADPECITVRAPEPCETAASDQWARTRQR